jgi:hypothetical protein
VELYDEAARDLLTRGPQRGAALPVVEDLDEGQVVSGLSTRATRNTEELRAALAAACAARDTQVCTCVPTTTCCS